jgi:hypothetical protein
MHCQSPAMVTSNIPTATRTSAAQKAEKKICATSLILKTACHDKKLWLVPVEAISTPAMVLDHPGTHSRDRSSLIVVSPHIEWPDKFLSLKLSSTEIAMLMKVLVTIKVVAPTVHHT